MVHPVIMSVPAGLLPTDGREKTMTLRLYARTALARSASFSGVVLGPLEKGASGEPLPSRGICWSLSHAQGCVAAVTSPRPIGIDVERIAAFTPVLMERVAGPSEWALASHVDNSLFCRFWTAKEAVLKASGAGLSGLPRCRVTKIVDEHELKLTLDSVTFTVCHYDGAPGHLAAITAAPREVTWHLLDLE